MTESPPTTELPTGTVRRGMVHESGGGVYVVQLDDGDRVEASLRGRLKQQQRTGGRVVAGDEVVVLTEDGTSTIESVDPRRSELVRRGRGRQARILAANLDRVFVVVAVREPRASAQLIDRFLVLVEASGLTPVLVLNKVDLEGARAASEEWRSLYRGIGYEALTTSAATGVGLEALTEALASGASALIGPSGAGKSSLLNAIDPELKLRTGALSARTGTGRHTTVGSRLIPLATGGLVADTPGFGDVGLWAVEPDEVAPCFPEFEAYAGDCRFRGCTHLHEPGCAVKEALEAGAIVPSRYESYGLLREEADSAREY